MSNITEKPYNELSKRLRQLTKDYRNMNLKSKNANDIRLMKDLETEIYKINNQLKAMDEKLGVTYNNSAYGGRYQIGNYKPLLTVSLLLKVVFYIALALLVFSFIEPYLPEFKSIEGDSTPFYYFPIIN